jgi:hypothetical protein
VRPRQIRAMAGRSLVLFMPSSWFSRNVVPALLPR